MPSQELMSFPSIAKIEPTRALQLGAAAAVAPLWASYFAAASVGVTYWWMTAWTRRTDAAPAAIEPKSFAPAAKEITAPVAAPAPVEVAVAEVAELIVPEIEAKTDETVAVIEAVAEAAVETAPLELHPAVEVAPAAESVAAEPAAASEPVAVAEPPKAKPASRKSAKTA
jgi:hypothetical protein